MKERIAKVKEQLDHLGLDAILIGSGPNRMYVSGFTGSNAMLYISKKKQVLVTDFRYMEQAATQCEAFEIVNQGSVGLVKTVMEVATNDQAKNIGFESDHTNYSTYESLGKYEAFHFVPTKQVVEKLRQVKDQTEQANIQKAEAIGDLAFSHILAYIETQYPQGVTENQIALEIERVMRQNGATATSFSTIVAAGAKSSLPHAVPADVCLKEGDFVVMDFGCVYNGYCSDMTRTIVIGEPTPKHKAIYETVLKAQEAALQAIRPGMKGKEVDKIARDIIEEAGYGDYFGHGLGHSLGVEIHENPRFSTLEEQVIETGMVLTVEPGIYLPGFGGVRIEDVVIVTTDGIKNITSSKKQLISIV